MRRLRKLMIIKPIGWLNKKNLMKKLSKRMFQNLNRMSMPKHVNIFSKSKNSLQALSTFLKKKPKSAIP